MRIVRTSKKRVVEAIKKYNLVNCDKEGGSGSMDYIEEGEEPEGGFTVHIDEKLIGWGVAWPNKEFHLLVRPKFRRQGIGSKIVERARKHFPDHAFCPWDDKTDEFFEKNQSPIHRNFSLVWKS